MSKYDAIIVGGGISGLSVGAMLAGAGKKVLVLEKGAHLGGRAYTTTRKGHVIDNGVHGPVLFTHLQQVFSRAGKPLPKWVPWTGGQIYQNGKWTGTDKLTKPGALRKILAEDIMRLSYDDIEKLDDVSLRDWVSERTDDEGVHLFFWNMAWTLCVGGNEYDMISAGEALYWFKEQLETYGDFKLCGGFYPDGIGATMQPLADSIIEKGGEVRMNTRVSNVVIKEKRVRGVEIEKGERIVPGQILDTEFIEAPIVVVAVPIWDLFKIVSPDEFPRWYVEWVKEVSEKVVYIWGIRYSMDRPILEDQGILRWWTSSPAGGPIALGSMLAQAGYGEAAGEYVADIWQQACWTDVPSNFKGTGDAIVGHEVRKMLNYLEKDVEVLFPDLAAHTRDKIRYCGIYGLAESPTAIGLHRPDVQPLVVKNLYLAGDTLRETRATGTNSAARCAIRCADAILRATTKKAG